MSEKGTIIKNQSVQCGDSGTSSKHPSTGVTTQFVDLHCHCLPNLDDGPSSVEDAVALCRALVDDHVCTVIATPHQLGRFESCASANEIRSRIRSLNQELVSRGITLRVLPGAEIRLDERLRRLLVEDEVLTLADMRRHVLLELPSQVFIDVESLVLELQSLGIHAVIAHPERNVPLLERPQALRRWLNCGAALQITAASLTGDFGPRAEQAAWRLIEEGWVAAVATDAHNHRPDPPRMTAAYRLIAATCGGALAKLLCIDNPSRIARGERLVSTYPSGGEEVA